MHVVSWDSSTRALGFLSKIAHLGGWQVGTCYPSAGILAEVVSWGLDSPHACGCLNFLTVWLLDSKVEEAEVARPLKDLVQNWCNVISALCC